MTTSTVELKTLREDLANWRPPRLIRQNWSTEPSEVMVGLRGDDKTGREFKGDLHGHNRTKCSRLTSVFISEQAGSS